MYNRLWRMPCIRMRRGLTLVELILVLALLSIVFVGLVQFYMAAQRSWTSTEVQGRISGEANVVLANISREVRSAEKPNGLAFALSDPNIAQSLGLANRSRLDIYRYDSALNKCIRVQYRLEANILKRGWVAATEAYPGPYFWNTSGTGSVLYPDIPAGNWTTLLSGVRNVDLFTISPLLAGDYSDPTAYYNSTRSKTPLSVRIELEINDTAHPLSQPIRVDVEYTVRGK